MDPKIRWFHQSIKPEEGQLIELAYANVGIRVFGSYGVIMVTEYDPSYGSFMPKLKTLWRDADFKELPPPHFWRPLSQQEISEKVWK